MIIPATIKCLGRGRKFFTILSLSSALFLTILSLRFALKVCAGPSKLFSVIVNCWGNARTRGLLGRSYKTFAARGIPRNSFFNSHLENRQRARGRLTKKNRKRETTARKKNPFGGMQAFTSPGK